MGVLLLFVLFAVAVSFVCSLLEATLLSARMVTLSGQEAAGNRGAGRLLDIKRRRLDDAISAILIVNTMSNTLGASLAGAMAAQLWGHASIGVFSGVLTFLILVFGEIVPKTLGAVYARTLSSVAGWLLQFLMRLMAPALVLSGSLTRLFRRRGPEPLSRAELAAMIEAATRDGALSGQESKLVTQLLRATDLKVEDVMTPRTVTFRMPVHATVADLLGDPEAEAFSRIPLYRDDPDNVVGYVLQRDVLKAAVQGPDKSRRLGTFVREIGFIPELVPVGQALRQFLERHESIAIATDEHGGVAGLVTLEDLTETLLGSEIVDEMDRTVDLRQQALKLRDRRLERRRQVREHAAGEVKEA